MAQDQVSSIITTTSGICGGMSKALSSYLILESVTIQGIAEVAIYAAISALVGYGVKKGMDFLMNRFKSNR